MTLPLSNTPPSTPDCDRPDFVPHHTLENARSPGTAASHGDISPDDPLYDSCTDDLNALLAADPEPDSCLDISAVPAAASAGAAADLDSTRPRTSEVFRSVLSQAAGQFAHSADDADERRSRPSGTHGSSDDRHNVPSLATSSADGLSRNAATSSDEYETARISWTGLLLLSYASAVTLALAWVLWTGRSISRVERTELDTVAQSGNSPNVPASAPHLVDPPLPDANITSLGVPIRVGNLEIHPVAITSKPVELVRSIDPYESRTQDRESLVLRVIFKNLGKDQPFAPLDRQFVREQSSRVDESYIETPGGHRIGLFPLAVDSEWTIRAQDFSPIEPGKELSTIVVSAPTSLSQLAEHQLWRVRLRTDFYKTDVIGIRFSRSQVATESE